ncbi:MAG: hypothetical protein GC165_19790 [Armatimonadetes bacterium]|nr:hypothetical protein [Armatimonadota bacterium]
MRRSRLILLLFAALGAANAFGQADISAQIGRPSPPAGQWHRGRMKLAHTNQAPKIDGKLDDACWKAATHGKGFFRLLSNDPVMDQTEVWMCADKENLYFAFHCTDRNPATILAKETQRNGNLNQDERVVVVIDSQSLHHDSSAFWVNAIGTQLQEMEGGVADNQAWQGDWHAATSRCDDGWIAEMSIPFRLLHYPKGAHSFGMFVARRKPDESNFTCWPYMPPQSDTGSIAQYATDFDDINPPYYAPKPTVSPYMLATTGQGTSARFGMDVKYPLTTSITGVATVKPDFQTVEGAVQDISFSYTEKYVPDRRPFFAEGGGVIDDSFLFYSQRIADVDFGLKVAGKNGPTTLGLLSTSSSIGDKQSANVATFDQQFGQYSGMGGTFLSSHQTGSEGEVAQVRAYYGWAKGMRNVRFFSNATQAWLGNGQHGQSLFANVNTYAGKGQLNGNLYVVKTDAGFDNPLGLVDETNTQGVGMNLNTFNVYDHGAVEKRNFYLSGSSFNHCDGSFFHRYIYAGSEFDMRNGMGYGVDLTLGSREKYADRSLSGKVLWNQKSLLSKGSLSVDFGRRQDMPYRFTALNQGFAANKQLSFDLSFGDLRLGSDSQTQTILTGTYRIDPLQSFGGRMVSQGSKTNVYFSYGHRTRKGNDMFVLLGDPNSPTTQRSVTLKMVWSF